LSGCNDLYNEFLLNVIVTDNLDGFPAILISLVNWGKGMSLARFLLAESYPFMD
jgi:hypothetical protein